MRFETFLRWLRVTTRRKRRGVLMTDDTVHNPASLTRCIHQGRGSITTEGLLYWAPIHMIGRLCRRVTSIVSFELTLKRRRTAYWMPVRWPRVLAIVQQLRRRLPGGLDGSSGAWWSVYASLRLLRLVDLSRTSLHALVQDLVPVVVSVVDRGCRTMGRRIRAGKIRREIRRQVSLKVPDIERRVQTHSGRYA